MTDTAPSSSRAVVAGFYGALSAGEVEGALGLLASDVRIEVMGSTPVSGLHVGPDAWVSDAMSQVFAKLDPEHIDVPDHFELFAVDGERVVARATGKALTTDGRRYDNSYCHLFRVVDGRIVELVEYCDTALLQDVVFRPSPPAG